MGITGQWYSAIENDYSSSGNLQTQEYTAAPGQWFAALQNLYDTSGDLTEQKFMGITGQWYSAIENDYSASGNPQTQEYTAAPGQWFSVLQDVYDTSGNFAHQNFTESDGSHIILIEAANATLELNSGFTGEIVFAGPNGTVKVDNSSSFSGTVVGMSGNDTIDFADIIFARVQPPSYSGTTAGGTLRVTDGSHTADIALLGNYLAPTFVASSDDYGGTAVVDPPATTHNQALC